jgi:hypothetical protein
VPPPPKGFILPKPPVRWLRSADVAMFVIDCFASLLHFVKPTALALLSTTATATTRRLSASQIDVQLEGSGSCEVLAVLFMPLACRSSHWSKCQYTRHNAAYAGRFGGALATVPADVPNENLRTATKPSSAQTTGCSATMSNLSSKCQLSQCLQPGGKEGISRCDHRWC